jgi:hypothetical protein
VDEALIVWLVSDFPEKATLPAVRFRFKVHGFVVTIDTDRVLAYSLGTVNVFPETPDTLKYLVPSLPNPPSNLRSVEPSRHVVLAAIAASQASEIGKEEVSWKARIEAWRECSEEQPRTAYGYAEISPEEPRCEGAPLKELLPTLRGYQESLRSQAAQKPPTDASR